MKLETAELIQLVIGSIFVETFDQTDDPWIAAANLLPI